MSESLHDKLKISNTSLIKQYDLLPRVMKIAFAVVLGGFLGLIISSWWSEKVVVYIFSGIVLTGATAFGVSLATECATSNSELRSIKKTIIIIFMALIVGSTSYVAGKVLERPVTIIISKLINGKRQGKDIVQPIKRIKYVQIYLPNSNKPLPPGGALWLKFPNGDTRGYQIDDLGRVLDPMPVTDVTLQYWVDHPIHHKSPEGINLSTIEGDVWQIWVEK